MDRCAMLAHPRSTLQGTRCTYGEYDAGWTILGVLVPLFGNLIIGVFTGMVMAQAYFLAKELYTRRPESGKHGAEDYELDEYRLVPDEDEEEEDDQEEQ